MAMFNSYVKLPEGIFVSSLFVVGNVPYANSYIFEASFRGKTPRRGLCLGLCWITSLILDEDMYCWHIRYWLDGETIKVSLWQYLADARSIRKIRKRIQRYLLDPAGNLPCSLWNSMALPYHAYMYIHTHMCAYIIIYIDIISCIYICMYIYIHYIYKTYGPRIRRCFLMTRGWLKRWVSLPNVGMGLDDVWGMSQVWRWRRFCRIGIFCHQKRIGKLILQHITTEMGV